MIVIDPYGACALVGALFCVLGWIKLTFNNIYNARYGYILGCAQMFLAFLIEFCQFTMRFIVEGHSTDTTMLLLLLKISLFASATLTFVYIHKSKNDL